MAHSGQNKYERTQMKKLIILAAGEGSRLRPYTNDRPKCLVDINGTTILDGQLGVATRAGIKDIVVVKGYCQEKVHRDGVRFYINEDYNTTNMVETMWCARDEFEDEIIVSYGDIIYEEEVLNAVLQSNHEISVAVDKGWRSYWEKRFDDPLSDAESLSVDERGRILNIGQKVSDISEIQGQFIGLIKFKGEGLETLKAVYEEARVNAELGQKPFGCDRPFKKLFMTDLLQGIIDSGYDIYEAPINRKWLEIDSPEDYALAQRWVQFSDNSLKIIA
jgi:choline kinase